MKKPLLVLIAPTLATYLVLRPKKRFPHTMIPVRAEQSETVGGQNFTCSGKTRS